MKMEMSSAGEVSSGSVKTDIATLSVSSLESYISCPLHYFIERIIKLEKKTTEPALCGMLVHTILERFHGEFPVPAHKNKMSDRMAVLIDEVFSSPLSEDFESRHSGKCWKNFFGSFLRKYAEGGNVFNVIEREKNIRVSAEDIDITGRIDRVDKVQGGLEIIDYKTSPGAKFKKVALRNRIGRGEHLALPVYAQALEDSADGSPGSCDITLLWMAHYEKPEDYPLKVTLQLNDEKTIQAVKEMKIKMIDAARNMKKGNFPPASKCPRRGCPHEDLCRRLKGADIYER